MKWTELQAAVKQAQFGIRNTGARREKLTALLKEVMPGLTPKEECTEAEIVKKLEEAINIVCGREKGIVPGVTVEYGKRGERQRGVVHSIVPGGWVTLIGGKRVLPPQNMDVVVPEVVQETG